MTNYHHIASLLTPAFVNDYPVGQNIAYQDWLCSDQRCVDSITEDELEPEWDKVLEDFYIEVEDFDKRVVQKFQQNPGQVIGHFTQVKSLI
ncbi:hypothetical protein AVEN_13505-1 [Araneus ventricosus]|uniref:Uncharacterized protein n=1 Tax=Araneus ventricosus TaxID=182803 RepID=A0A4Y2DWH7_ARAVE|nr:hypothetical protein AVEN_13505-1 [Araneus ventricosus]